MSKNPKVHSQKTARYLTVEQAADELNQSARSIWRLIESGDLRVHRFGRSTRIAREDLEAYVACNRR